MANADLGNLPISEIKAPATLEVLAKLKPPAIMKLRDAYAGNDPAFGLRGAIQVKS